MSELVREPVRERYLGGRDERMKAMQEFVGIRKERPPRCGPSMSEISGGESPRPAQSKMTVLIDSRHTVEVSRGKDANIVSRWTDLSNSEAAVLYSPISVAELRAGARSNEYDALNNLFHALKNVLRSAKKRDMWPASGS